MGSTSSDIAENDAKAPDAESLREENKRLKELVIRLSQLVLTERRLRQLCDIDRDAPRLC